MITVPVIAFVGPSGSGKTQLITQLVAAFKAKGYRVGAIKHTHHDFEIDCEGKDSFKMRQAGAGSVLITSAYKIALIKETQEEPKLEELAARYFGDVDIVLAEGFSQSQAPKIFVSKLASVQVNKLRNLVALVTDDPKMRKSSQGIPVFSFDEIEKLADFLEASTIQHLRPQAVKAKIAKNEGSMRIMALKYQVLKEAQKELQSLIGLGLYQAESEALKDYLRELQSRYTGEHDLMQLRQRLDRALGSKALSAVLRQMREEEMH